MFSSWGKRLIVIYLTLAAFIFVIWTGTTRVQSNSFVANNANWSPAQIKLQSETNPVVPPQTKIIPTPGSKTPTVKTTPTAKPHQQTKSQPKQVKQTQAISGKVFQTTQAFKKYTPKYAIALANSNNYGERYSQDANGLPVTNQPIIVIHETASTASSAINTFRTPHTDDNKQVSYHALITLDGMIIYIVPPDKRAYGAGNSIFVGQFGAETVKTNPNLPASVNNFAYHVSLETPRDGIGNNHQRTHSGYRDQQYKSLAWLLAQSQVPENRITTHRAVDRSGQRIDPRSFDFNKFFNLLRYYRQPVLN
ncbi:peptidoglycan recognition protein family protein [Calothrix rhizosoleniae]|uniref:peptidoglycan recognition protein family protein n=1 Tax=Calothrix rhizosoleniae TaxID=888997 RepID=UPI000B49A446